MTLKAGIDFGTSNSGVAVYDGQRVNLLPIDRQNVLPEVVKSVLYVTPITSTASAVMSNNGRVRSISSAGNWNMSVMFMSL
jgi:molecular chaperone DnaK (HSP70)